MMIASKQDFTQGSNKCLAQIMTQFSISKKNGKPVTVQLYLVEIACKPNNDK